MTTSTRAAARFLLILLLLSASGLDAGLAQEAEADALNPADDIARKLSEAEALLQPDHTILPQELQSIRDLGTGLEAYPDLETSWHSLLMLAREKLYAQQQQAAGGKPAALALEELRRGEREAGRLKVRKTLFWTFLGSGVTFLVVSNLAAYAPDIADRAVEKGSAGSLGFWWNMEDLVAEYNVSEVSAGLSVLSFALSAVMVAGGAVP